MIVVVAITIALGAVLLWALYSEQVPLPAHRLVRRWTGMPATADIRRRDFPLAVAGYDPRAVDAHLRAVADAVAQLRDQVEGVRAGDGQPRVGAAAASAWSIAATPAAPGAPPPAEGSSWAPPDLRTNPAEGGAPSGAADDGTQPASADDAQEGPRDDG